MYQDNSTVITWRINNYGYFWQMTDEDIVSPMFHVYKPKETKWKLLFFPECVSSDENLVSFFLQRDKDCNGPETIKVKYSLDILSKDGLFYKFPKTEEFRKYERHGISDYKSIQDIKRECLEQDVLTIRCEIFRINGEEVEEKQIFARTIIGGEKLFFNWSIPNFSNFAPGQTQSHIIKDKSKYEIMLISAVIDTDIMESIFLDTEIFDLTINFYGVKAFIIDSNKKRVASGQHQWWSSYDIGTKFPLIYSKKDLVEKKNLYLPNDELTLGFELTITTGIAYEGIEKYFGEYTSHPILNEVDEDWRKCIAHKNLYDCPCALINDLTSLYEEKSTCDLKFKAGAKKFPVHTFILSARSAVFKKIFSNYMKKKLNGSFNAPDLDDKTVRTDSSNLDETEISGESDFADETARLGTSDLGNKISCPGSSDLDDKIVPLYTSDLDDETAGRFLRYLYTDQLEDLKWEDAMQLYTAAVKYAVPSLSEKCSSFLKNNLSLENVCEALKHSDMYEDKDLKETVQTFILENAKLVFKSKEWMILTDAKPKLALETTLRFWYKK